MKRFFLISALLFIVSIICNAQENVPKSKWAIEPSLTFPIKKIYMLNMAYNIRNKSELLIGFAFQNWKNLNKEPLGQAHAYTITAGYRYHIWKELNAEVMLFPAYNNFLSYVDNKWYNGYELWIEYRIGYKIKWNINSYGFYLNIQPGIGHGLYLQHLWPDLNKNTMFKESIMFVPQIALGIKL